MSSVLRVSVGHRKDPKLRTCILPRLSGQNAGGHQQRWEHPRDNRLPRLPTPHVHQETQGSAGVPRGRQGSARRADAGGASPCATWTAPERTARVQRHFAQGSGLDRPLPQGHLRASPSTEADQPRPQCVSDLYHKHRGATHGRGGCAQRCDDRGSSSAKAEAQDLHNCTMPARSALSFYYTRTGGCDLALDSVGIAPWQMTWINECQYRNWWTDIYEGILCWISTTFNIIHELCNDVCGKVHLSLLIKIIWTF